MKWICVLAVCVCALVSTGCVSTVDGRQRAGWPMKDKIESRYERPASEIWTAAKDVLRYNGSLFSEDLLTNTLQGSVNERNVWVKVEELDQLVTRVTIQTRTRGGAGDVELAGEIDKQIAIRLASGNLTPGAVSFPRQ